MDKKAVDTLIKAGFWASVIVSLLLLVHYGVAEDCVVSVQSKSCWIPEGCSAPVIKTYTPYTGDKPGIAYSLTSKGNFVMGLMPDPNADVLFDDVMLCEGNAADNIFDACHDAILLPEPLELRHEEAL